MERDDCAPPAHSTKRNFNSRAHVERDLCEIYEHMTSSISTHALTWSATRRLDSLASHVNFNSRAHVERDFVNTFSIVFLANFNSRAHVERDRLQSQKIIYIWKFQLTRSRGARPPYSGLTSIRYQKFQLTRSRGARRLFQTLGMYSSSAFQLTRSRGARLLT